VDWANDWSIFTEPFDKNLVYQFHYYCWDTPAKLKGIQRYLDCRERFNAPIWVGETGERDNAIYWATTEYFEANNIGWSFWPWKKMDTENTPYSINRPQGWDAVIAYSRGEAKPPRDVAQKAFDELLVNIRLANCRYHAEVVNAMLHRAPARIQGENYGHGGPDISYSVKNKTGRSKFYRLDEPVPVSVREAQRPRSDQYITLTESEWTAYKINSDTARRCEVTLRARAENVPAEAWLSSGDRALEVKITQTNWTDIKPGSIQLNRGVNQLKWMVKRGTVELDWFDIGVAEKTQEPAGLGPATTTH